MNDDGVRRYAIASDAIANHSINAAPVFAAASRRASRRSSIVRRKSTIGGNRVAVIEMETHTAPTRSKGVRRLIPESRAMKAATTIQLTTSNIASSDGWRGGAGALAARLRQSKNAPAATNGGSVTRLNAGENCPSAPRRMKGSGDATRPSPNAERAEAGRRFIRSAVMSPVIRRSYRE